MQRDKYIPERIERTRGIFLPNVKENKQLKKLG